MNCVKSAFYKKLYRDIYHAKGQFIAVMLVIVCGIASYIDVTFCFQNLTLTRDTYCREYRLADLFFTLDRAPRSVLRTLKSIPGVTAATGRIVFDVSLDIPGNKDALVGRIISLPDRKSIVLNDIYLTSGSYFRPEQENGVLVNDAFCEKNRLKIGDVIWANINNRKRKLRLIGTAMSPEYIYTIRNPQQFVPSPKKFAICYVKESFAENAFGYQEAINDACLSLSSPEFVGAVKEKAEDILDPYGLLAKIEQKDQISYNFLDNELMGLRASVKIVPAIFLGVAALVIFIILSRIVRRERIQIGVFMALGHGRFRIMFHYLQYAFLTAFLGSLLGLYLGNYLGKKMLLLYGEFYRFPVLHHKVYWGVFASAIFLSLFYCGLAGLLAVWKIMKIDPAMAMRPAPPAGGRRILLERAPFLWSGLSFGWKILFRNLFRHKSRAFFIILGVALSCTILIQAFFGKDCMDYVIHHEFSATQKQDIKVFFSDERPRSALYEMKRVPGVKRAEPIYECAFEAKYGWREKNIVVIGLPSDGRLRPLLDSEHRFVPIEKNGITLSAKLAEILGVKRGDKLVMKPLLRGRKEKTVVVKNVVSQYFGINGYMEIESLSQLLGEGFVANGALLSVENGERVHTELKKRPAVTTIEFTETLIKNFEEAIGASMYIMTGILSLFAGIISFAIIYNSAIIAIGERERELTTMKVMGFTMSEITRMVFNEYFLLASLGVAIGLPLGKWLVALTISAYDTEIYRFPLIIYPGTYVKTVLYVMLFVIVSQWACRRKLKQLDVVEVLKVRE